MAAVATAAAVFAGAAAPPRSSPAPRVTLELPREPRLGELALQARRLELGLEAERPSLSPRSCEVRQACPDGHVVACSATGRMTDCGPVHDAGGAVAGVICLGFRVVEPGRGYVAREHRACR